MSNAPRYAGSSSAPVRLSRPPSSAEPTVTFDGPLIEVCPCSLKESEPCHRARRRDSEVRATATGERANGRVALVTGGAQGFGRRPRAPGRRRWLLLCSSPTLNEGAAAEGGRAQAKASHTRSRSTSPMRTLSRRYLRDRARDRRPDLVVPTRASRRLRPRAGRLRVPPVHTITAFFLVTKHLGHSSASTRPLPEWLDRHHPDQPESTVGSEQGPPTRAPSSASAWSSPSPPRWLLTARQRDLPW